MTVQEMPNSMATKAIVTVAEMARMVGLSRARFYQLQRAGVFPMPVYSIETRRPIFTEEQQQACLEVRRRNFGVNGRPILFYAKRIGGTDTSPRPRQPRPTAAPRPQRHAEIIEALKLLGVTATAAQVDSALAAAFPNGATGVDEGTLIRACFRQLKRQNSADNVGR